MLEFLALEKNVLAIVILLVSIPLSKIIFVIFKKIFLKISSKTKTTLDDILLQYMETPLEFALVLVGAYIALVYTGVASEHLEIVNTLFGTIAVLNVVWLFFKLENGFVKWHTDTHEITKTQKTVYVSLRNIVFIIVMIIAFLIILRLFNVEMTPLVASLGIGGLAVALALQSTLSNYFAGLYLAADNAVKIGDYVESDGIGGFVEKIGWRSTKIRTPEDNLIIVPNAKLSESTLTNYSDPTEELLIKIPCGVAYGTDLEKTENITIETAKKVLQNEEGGVKEFEPFIRYHKFGDSNIEFNIFLRAKDFKFRGELIHKFMKELVKEYEKNRIEISYPVRKVYMDR